MIDFELNTGHLFNSSGSFVADFALNQLNDNTQILSLDWQNRLLADTVRATQLSWTTSGISIATALSSPNLILNGSTSGTLTQTANPTTTPYSIVWPAAQSSGVQVLENDGAGNLSWASASTGTVTSVDFADASTTPIFAVSGNPVTSSGTLTITLDAQVAASVFAGPVSGADAQPSFRALAATDIPDISATYVTQAEVGVASGVASLDSSGKVPVGQLPSVVMEYQGAWDPSTNTPTVADGTGTNGNVYYVTVAFAGPVGGLSDPSMVNFQIGDLIIYNGTVWQLVTPAAGVMSVNGAQGAVIVNAINQLTGDVAAGPASGSASAISTIQPGVVTPSKLATVTDGVTLDQAGAGGTLEIMPAGVGATQIATGAFDQVTIVGGAGTPASVASAPLSVLTCVAGQTFAANTSYAVRWGIFNNGETPGQVYAADPDTSSFDEFYVIGVAFSAAGVIAGANISVTLLGSYRIGSGDTGFLTTDQGNALYLGSGGTMSNTAPSTAGLAITRIGMIVETNVIYINPAPIAVN